MASHNNETNEKRYKAPALEKGLDVLELLARHGEPLTLQKLGNLAIWLFYQMIK